VLPGSSDSNRGDTIAGSFVLQALACIVALSLAVGACAPSSSSSPASSVAQATSSPSQTSVPSATTPPETASVVPVSFDVAGVGWESEFVFMEPSGLGRIKGVIAGGPGFVMWSDEAGGRPGFLLSGAGADWGQVDSTVTGRTMLTVVADHADLLALASDTKGRVEVWRSPDGKTWKSTSTTGINGTPSALVVTSFGYVAAGRGAPGCGLATWTSPDALTWTAAGSLSGDVSPCEGGVSTPGVDQLLGGADGLLALGHLADGESTVWTSPDGRSWERRSGPPTGQIARVTQGGPGYVAVGDDGRTPATAAAWTSLDGTTWTAASAQASFVGATMANVVALADGRLVSVGSEQRPTGGPQFVAWTSRDAKTWERSPAPLCQNLDVCNDAAAQPPLLATDGLRLVGYDGSINILASPPVTAGLRPATLALGFDDPPAGTWTSGTVAGTCAPADDPSGLVFLAAYPRLLDVGAASGTSTFVPSLQLELGPEGSVQRVVYDRGDDAGFTGRTSPLPGEFLIGPDHMTIDAGSTALQGQLDFRDLPVSRDDSSLPSVPPVSGSLSWKCG
jgi:hypothetical protein